MLSGGRGLGAQGQPGRGGGAEAQAQNSRSWAWLAGWLDTALAGGRTKRGGEAESEQ